MHLFYFLWYLYQAVGWTERRKGFKAQIRAILLHRKDSKNQGFSSNEEEKRSYQLDASGMLSFTGYKEVPYVVHKLFSLSNLKLWYCYCQRKHPQLYE